MVVNRGKFEAAGFPYTGLGQLLKRVFGISSLSISQGGVISTHLDCENKGLHHDSRFSTSSPRKLMRRGFTS